jgi:hypothetical protein
MPPVMSRREALVIWMSSTAIKAPNIVPNTPTQVRKSTRCSSASGICNPPSARNTWCFVCGHPCFTRTFGSVDKPGTIRASYPRMLTGSKRILTGTRWTIFVKFPVALSGGRSAYTAPVPA